MCMIVGEPGVNPREPVTWRGVVLNLERIQMGTHLGIL